MLPAIGPPNIPFWPTRIVAPLRETFCSYVWLPEVLIVLFKTTSPLLTRLSRCEKVLLPSIVVTFEKLSVRSFPFPSRPPAKVPLVPVSIVAALNVTGLWYSWLPMVVTLAPSRAGPTTVRLLMPLPSPAMAVSVVKLRVRSLVLPISVPLIMPCCP